MSIAELLEQIHVCNSEAFGGGEIGSERQQKLYNLRVAVVGSGPIGQMVLGCLYGLGVGKIYFMDNSENMSAEDKGFLYGHFDNIRGKKKSDLVFEALQQINPVSKIVPRHGRFSETFVYDFNPQIIIDATNDSVSKERVIQYAFGFSSKAVPVISLASDYDIGAITCYWPKNRVIKIFTEKPNLETLLQKEFDGRAQGGFTSGIVAGLAVEEIRKFAFSYNENDSKLESNVRLAYNIYSITRKGMESDLKKNNIPFYRSKRVLVAGAGALGNWASIYLSQMGLGQVDFLDYDEAEEKNLNRQIQLRGRIREKKAKILSERLKEIDPHVKTGHWDGKLCDELSGEDRARGLKKISEEGILAQKYDAILGCFDNKYARLWLNDFSVRNNIPYIDGGTHPTAGQLAVYIPGKTRNVDQQLNLHAFPEQTSTVCEGPNPSVVMSNAIIGGAMVGELIHVFNPGLNATLLEGPIYYTISAPQRIYAERRLAR
jgi:molybdopterin/thiamine biosynthesis adenylyltransferase